MVSLERQVGVISETPLWLTDPKLFVGRYRGASVLVKAEMLDRLSHSVLEADPQISTFQYYQKIASFLPIRTHEIELKAAIEASNTADVGTQRVGRVVLCFWALRSILSVVSPNAALDETEKGEAIEEMVAALASGERSLTWDVKTCASEVNRKANGYVEKYLEERGWRNANEFVFTDTAQNDSAVDVVFEEAAAREGRCIIAGGFNERLNPRQQKVIYGRIVEERTLREVGDDIECSKTRIVQMEAVALKKLRSVARRLAITDAPEIDSREQKPEERRVLQLNPTSEQMQIVYDCLPEKATVAELRISRSALNKITTLGYYFRLKGLLAKTSEELEKEMGQCSDEISSALKYQAKELFGELLAGNAPWAGEKAEEARSKLVFLESKKLQSELVEIKNRPKTEVGGVV
ncbi:MAG: hypothetical protein HYW33_03270 [Candidatus Blackburnbacteria bacterium]|nr:hypothetical protein [Candidatus Blackburnbacteria bacterium]